MRKLVYVILILVSLIGFVFLLENEEDFLNETLRSSNSLNLNKIDDVLSSQGVCSSLIVGSSLSSHLNQDCLYRSYNLSIAGSSSLTGLEILIQNEIIPDTLFVETNEIRKGIENYYVDYSKQLIPKWTIFQERNVGLYFVGLIDKVIGFVSYHYLDYEMESGLNRSFLVNETFQKEIKEMDDDKNSIEMVSELFNQLNFFNENGTVIYLFEIPKNRALNLKQSNLNLSMFINKEAKKYNFRFLSFDKKSSYQTSDGFHLTDIGLKDYLKAFCAQRKS